MDTETSKVATFACSVQKAGARIRKTHSKMTCLFQGNMVQWWCLVELVIYRYISLYLDPPQIKVTFSCHLMSYYDC